MSLFPHRTTYQVLNWYLRQAGKWGVTHAVDIQCREWERQPPQTGMPDSIDKLIDIHKCIRQLTPNEWKTIHLMMTDRENQRYKEKSFQLAYSAAMWKLDRFFRKNGIIDKGKAKYV